MSNAGRVIRYLGLTVLLSLGATAYLVNKVIELVGDRETLDPTLVAMLGLTASPGVAALGALGAILATTRSESLPEPPQPVTVMNQPDEPVPVDAGRGQVAFLVASFVGSLLALIAYELMTR